MKLSKQKNGTDYEVTINGRRLGVYNRGRWASYKAGVEGAWQVCYGTDVLYNGRTLRDCRRYLNELADGRA